MSVADKKSDGGKTGADGVVVIKKYANRRLYNTSTSTYVTLEDLAKMVREGTDFVVYDAKTNEELTRQILTQIIFEEESRGEALLPIQFLRQLIGFYGGQMQGVLPSYLEMSLESFSRQQEQLRSSMGRAFGGAPGAGLMDEAVKRNMAMFEQAMKMFPGFTPPVSAPPPPPPAEDALAEMRRQMSEMQARLEALASGKGS
jgi:polyhydroxyalkanoate synthesis repressor PhaR